MPMATLRRRATTAAPLLPTQEMQPNEAGGESENEMLSDIAARLPAGTHATEASGGSGNEVLSDIAARFINGTGGNDALGTGAHAHSTLEKNGPDQKSHMKDE